MKNIEDHSLYLVISEEYGMGRDSPAIARAAIAGNVDIIQMREKNKPAPELIALGKRLSRLCRDSGVTFIVNDDPVLAAEAAADGVHLGQEDILKYPLKEARDVLGRDRIIGVSTHSPEQFEKANRSDVDYIAFGPIFETRTKDYFLGTQNIKDILKIANKPVFFIGGINLSNIDDVLKEGARNIALIRGITEAEDISVRTKEFKLSLRGAVGDEAI